MASVPLADPEPMNFTLASGTLAPQRSGIAQ